MFLRQADKSSIGTNEIKDQHRGELWIKCMTEQAEQIIIMN